MTIISGHYDGTRIVLDEPPPTGIHVPARVKVVFEEGGASEVLKEIIDLAVASDELPSDYAAQHEHYVKGTPRK